MNQVECTHKQTLNYVNRDGEVLNSFFIKYKVYVFFQFYALKLEFTRLLCCKKREIGTFDLNVEIEIKKYAKTKVLC